MNVLKRQMDNHRANIQFPLWNEIKKLNYTDREMSLPDGEMQQKREKKLWSTNRI
jgi:hypothetical protein